MTNDELLEAIANEYSLPDYLGGGEKSYNALRAVVQLIKEKQDWLDLTLGDIPMTNEQFYRREERWSLLAEFKATIEKELM